jgi:SAM-dependent methyltransferase
MIAIPIEDGTLDALLIGLWSGAKEQALWRWKQQTPELHDFLPDYHRLQLEYWIWSHWKAGRLAGSVLDIGVYDRRQWIGDGYRTFGEPGSGCDVEGDLTLVFPSDFGGEVDAIICTEVLEHCVDPFQAMRRLEECLRPGGLLLVTSPFIWSDHKTEDYGDYWRFTSGGWKILTAAFTDVQVIECEWTAEGASAYDQLRRWEGFGFRNQTRAATGYLVSARRRT